MDGLTLRAEYLGLSDEALEHLAHSEPVEITRGGQFFARVRVPSDVSHPGCPRRSARDCSARWMKRESSFVATATHFRRPTFDDCGMITAAAKIDGRIRCVHRPDLAAC